MSTKLRASAAILLLLAVSGASAEEGQSSCLPADLKLRLAFAEPKQIADALRQLDHERKDAGKLEVLKRRFVGAGCSLIEEQTGPGLSEPNLICRIAGRKPDEIAIGSSPLLDGWGAAALLPEIARAIAATPREHGYAIALLSRSAVATPAGARAFAQSFGERRPRVFVHVGVLGSQLPQVGPEAAEEQVCIVDSVARAVAGVSVDRIKTWSEIGVPCFEESRHGVGGVARTCDAASLTRVLDTAPFVRAAVPVVGLYAYPKRDPTIFSLRRKPRFDAAAYVASYRILAAVAVAFDALPGPTN